MNKRSLMSKDNPPTLIHLCVKSTQKQNKSASKHLHINYNNIKGETMITFSFKKYNKNFNPNIDITFAEFESKLLEHICITWSEVERLPYTSDTIFKKRVVRGFEILESKYRITVIEI